MQCITKFIVIFVLEEERNLIICDVYGNSKENYENQNLSIGKPTMKSHSGFSIPILHKKYTSFAKGGAIRYKLSYNQDN